MMIEFSTPHPPRAVRTVVTSDPSRSGDGSKWIFQLDGHDPKVLYATWILKDGTTRLDRVRFTKGN